MYVEMSKGPFCQSCGMPMRVPADFGTATDGVRVNDYCHFCFDHGDFTDPSLTVQQMIDRCVTFTTRQTFMTESHVRTMMQNAIPRLKRWREPAHI